VAAGTGIKVYLAKAWSLVAEFNDHSDKVWRGGRGRRRNERGWKWEGRFRV